MAETEMRKLINATLNEANAYFEIKDELTDKQKYEIGVYAPSDNNKLSLEFMYRNGVMSQQELQIFNKKHRSDFALILYHDLWYENYNNNSHPSWPDKWREDDNIIFTMYFSMLRYMTDHISDEQYLQYKIVGYACVHQEFNEAMLMQGKPPENLVSDDMIRDAVKEWFD